MKKYLKAVKRVTLNFLISLLDKNFLEHFKVGPEFVTFEGSAILPKDGKWHHFAATAMFWFKNGKTKKESYIDDVAVFSDGVKEKNIKKYYKFGKGNLTDIGSPIKEK